MAGSRASSRDLQGLLRKTEDVMGAPELGQDLEAPAGHEADVHSGSSCMHCASPVLPLPGKALGSGRR